MIKPWFDLASIGLACRQFTLAAAIFAAFFIAGCSSETARLSSLDSDAVILAFGDSLTFGTGAGHGHSYPAELARLTGRKVINGGVPGEISATGAKRLPALLKRARPDLVILCHGANDLLRKMNKQQMAENLRTMIRLAQQHGTEVVLVGVPAPRLAFMKTEPIYDTIAQEFNLPYQGTIIAELEQEPSLKSDQIHFNAEGYKRMAEAVYRVLRDDGAL